MGRRMTQRTPSMAAILFLFTLISCFLCALSLPPGASAADDSVCAKVKIEIDQELTLERQAFDAHMKINNGLDNISLEDVNVEISFADEQGNVVRATTDPDDTTALFFFRINSLENITRVDGFGSVAPASSADIHWLIIPAPGASKGVSAGTIYYVGATLTYTIGGEEHSTTVSPDHIFVKPMPEMTLDYFLPGDVYGDDAFTTEIEPPVPFSLGVRVLNSGTGTAKKLKIDSAQPKIVDNSQGLPVDFVIQGSEVNGKEVQKSLLIDFGDILPDTSGVGRWIMTCSLSGRFVEFKAEFSHADELGGDVTSLIDAVNTHVLVRDVLVDLPGRDGVRDFLAKDGGVYRVYESESIDTAAVDQSASATLALKGQTGSEISYTLSAPPIAGFMFLQLSDPGAGQKVLKSITRSDGKKIKTENGWLSKSRGSGPEWQYYLNLFDADTQGSYTVVFDDPAFVSKPPVLQFIPDRTGSEGATLSFVVSASDPDGTVPKLSAAPLPALARFNDLSNGTGTFQWTPATGQTGKFDLTFTASDGTLKAAQRASITICPAADSNCNGIPDTWEMLHFGNLSRDGKGDFDGDGISDLDEYLAGTDPTVSNVPTVPVILSPVDGAETAEFEPGLTIQNSTSAGGGPALHYEFELYSDPQMADRLESASLPEGQETTVCTFPSPLTENTRYTFRVRATNGLCASKWAYATFFVNTANEPPGSFALSGPRDHAQVSTLTPLLQVTNSKDPDGDTITYGFQVFASDGSTVVATSPAISPDPGGTTSWQVSPELQEDTWYTWRAVATDRHGAAVQIPLSTFLVNVSNGAPTAPAVSSPAAGLEIAAAQVDLTVDNALDPEGDTLTYSFELDTANTFDGASKATSGTLSEGLSGHTLWHVSGLSDHTNYFWRVKASDGSADSPWTTGSFFVNLANEAPSTPTVKNPGTGAWVAALKPTLELTPSLDPDQDPLTYGFEVYADAQLATLVWSGVSDTPTRAVSTDLTDHTRYFWRARAIDEHGAQSAWTAASAFLVISNGVDDPPDITVTAPAQDVTTPGTSVRIAWMDTDPENEALIDLYYATDRSGTGAVLIAGGIALSVNGAGGSLLWDVTGVPEGTYYIFATIMDRSHSKTSYAAGAVTIDR